VMILVVLMFLPVPRVRIISCLLPPGPWRKIVVALSRADAVGI
jgi:hypothetical protein